MNSSIVGLELKKARKRAGLTQVELAKRMSTTQSSIARSESGLVEPSISFLERFVMATREPIRIGSLMVWPFDLQEDATSSRNDRIRRALGDYVFNPWQRNPSAAEKKSLDADGLTREFFEGSEITSASRG